MNKVEDPDDFVLDLFQNMMDNLTDEDNIMVLEYKNEKETEEYYSRRGLAGVAVTSETHIFDVITEDCKTATIQITEEG